MQKILIVEDDIDIQDILKNHLIDPVKIFSIRIQTVDRSVLTVKIGSMRQIMRKTIRYRMCSGGQLMNMRRG